MHRQYLCLGLMGVTAFACVAPPASAIDPFLQQKEEGWFWYKDPPEPPEPEPLPELPPPPPPVIAPAAPEPLSVEWFKTTYPGILNAAIDNPSAENVANYRYATRVMLDKASNFAHEFKRQALLDPLLDESNRYPFSQAARGSFQRYTREQKRAGIEAMTDSAGLWVFFDAECPFCPLQYPVIRRTARERGFIVTYITPDGQPPEWMEEEDHGLVRADTGQSAVLEINVRPATALVIPPENITVLTQGMLAQDLLEERILVAGDAMGLLTQAEREAIFPMEKGLLTPEEIRAAGQSMQADPQSVTPTVQQYLVDP